MPPSMPPSVELPRLEPPRFVSVRKAGITLCVLLAGMVGLIRLHQWLDIDFQSAWTRAMAQKQQAQFLLNNSDNERLAMAHHLPLLQTLGARSIYGDAKRLEWVEHLRGIEKRHAGLTVQYEIASERLVSGHNDRAIGVFLTTMTLHLGVFHEGDVLTVLDEIKAADLGYFYLRQCVLTRPDLGATSLFDASFKPSTVSPRLTAMCELGWLHIKPITP